MPEQISKYPDVTIEVLQGAGARCGDGVEQKILKQCPRERFCALPSGEICVYGVADIPQMTQITKAELAAVVCPAQAGSIWPEMTTGVLLALGLAVGLLRSRSRR